MPATKELLFRINEESPYTFPMERLAEYLQNLAKLLGSTKSVHFIRVDEGSAACAMVTDASEEPKIIIRVQEVAKGNGTQEALEAYGNLVALLEEDQTSAELERENGEVILSFARPTTTQQETFGPFWQDGSLDGVLMKIGGIDETVPVHLVGYGGYHICNTDRDTAKDLAPRLFGGPIRVYGRGKWMRTAEGKWEMGWFDILRFEDLDDSSLPEVVSRLRAIPGNDLMSLADPLEEMRKIRHGEE